MPHINWGSHCCPVSTVQLTRYYTMCPIGKINIIGPSNSFTRPLVLSHAPLQSINIFCIPLFPLTVLSGTMFFMLSSACVATLLIWYQKKDLTYYFKELFGQCLLSIETLFTPGPLMLPTLCFLHSISPHSLWTRESPLSQWTTP